MAQDDDDVNIYEQIKGLTTFKNQNNFDDYFALVLPTLSI